MSKLNTRLKFLAMDTVTDILTDGLKRNQIRARIYLADLTEEQESEVTDMVRSIILNLMNSADDQTMMNVLEKY